VEEGRREKKMREEKGKCIKGFILDIEGCISSICEQLKL
jgi:hypothetical protein